MFFRNLKALSLENHALFQLKELFLESLAEKDQEILQLSENLCDLQRISSEKEHFFQQMLRKQAIEADEREESLRKLHETALEAVESQLFRRHSLEIKQIYSNFEGFSQKHEALEQRFSQLQREYFEERHKLLQKVAENQELSAKNEIFGEEVAKLRVFLKNSQRKLAENCEEFREKEREFLESLSRKDAEMKQCCRKLLENEQNLLLFSNKSQLFAHKLEKKREKCETLREELRKSRENCAESCEKLAQTREILENTRETLKNTRETLKNTRRFRRKTQEKMPNLREELQNSQENASFFEKVRGIQVFPSKFREIREVFEEFEASFNENWENCEVSEEIRRNKERILAILEKIQRDFAGIKGNLQEIERERDEYKRNLREFVEKHEENLQKTKESKGVFSFLWG